MKKKLFALLLTFAMLLSLAACGGQEGAAPSTSDGGGSTTGSDGGAAGAVELEDGMVDTSAFKNEKDHYTIGFSNASIVNTWRVQMVYELQQEVENLGNVDLIITDAGNDAAKQVSDIQDLLSQGVDGLLVAPVSSSATDNVCRQALEEGIPVIVFNAEVEDEDCYLGFVGSDAFDFGYSIGKWLVEQIAGKGNIIVLNGVAGNGISEQREAGLMQAIAELPDGGEEINILATYYADWAYDKGKQSAEQALAAYPNIDAVWSQGGAMAQGAIEAFQAAGRDLVPITGEDNNGFLKTWKKNQENGLITVSASEPTWQSAVALNELLDCLAGKPVPKKNYLAIPTITEAELDEYVRPEYSDAFWCNSHLSKETADKYYLEG